MTNELIVTETAANPYAIMPVMDYEIALTRRQLVINFTRRAMIEGQDYGKIPGAGDKPTLLKPGAEKLASLFGLSPIFDTVESEMDWTGKAHDGEPFFYIRCRCTLKRGDLIVGQGVGSCNSWEKKYRYRQGERVCPACGQPAIIKGKAQYGGGWVCFRKKNGCGAQYRDGDPAIEGQTVGQVKNPDPADVVNTIDKMAQKRALVAAVLIAVNASEMFTQDIEDVNDAEWTPAPEPQPAPKPKASAPTPAPADPEPAAPKANGKPAADPGPLTDDELVIQETEAAGFMAAAAALLQTDTETLAQRYRALGYKSISGKWQERLGAYRRLRADLGTADDIMQPALVAVEDGHKPGAEYED